jgi:hypothetical protein
VKIKITTLPIPVIVNNSSSEVQRSASQFFNFDDDVVGSVGAGLQCH